MATVFMTDYAAWKGVALALTNARVFWFADKEFSALASGATGIDLVCSLSSQPGTFAADFPTAVNAPFKIP